MINQLTYILHMLSAIVFIGLLAFPFVAKKLAQRSHDEIFRSLKAWRIVVLAAHLFLIIALVTGIWMTSGYSSTWFWMVIAVFLAMGAFLGIVAKSLRLVMQAVSQMQAIDQPFKKLTRFSNLLALSIVVMIALMYARW
jgi:hypothetical protein